jgi:hypothetical protein
MNIVHYLSVALLSPALLLAMLVLAGIGRALLRGGVAIVAPRMRALFGGLRRATRRAGTLVAPAPGASPPVRAAPLSKGA